jgi:hypothetical protein
MTLFYCCEEVRLNLSVEPQPLTGSLLIQQMIYVRNMEQPWQDYVHRNRFLDFQRNFRSPLIHRPDDGGSTHLWNVGLLQREYTELYPRKLSSSYPLRREPEISNFVVVRFPYHSDKT